MKRTSAGPLRLVTAWPVWAAMILGPHACPLDGASLEFRPVADVEVRQGTPGSGVGNGLTVVSGGLGVFVSNEHRRALLQFDLTVVPPDAEIVSASLSVEVVKVPEGSSSSAFALRRVLRPWTEAEASWNRAVGTELWEVPGVSGTRDAVPEASATVLVDAVGTNVFESTPALVADVKAWTTDPSANHGWLLVSEAEGTLRTARHFAAREDPARTPVLTVEFNTNSGTIEPRLETPRVVDGTLQFQFVAAAGRTYAVETRESLSAGTWATVTNYPTGLVGTVVVTNTIDGPSRFYRLNVQTMAGAAK